MESSRQVWKNLWLVGATLIFVMAAFGFYFVIGLTAARYSVSHSIDDSFLGLDQGRVMGDMLNPGANHFRTQVHPLFVLLTQTPARFISTEIGNPALG